MVQKRVTNSKKFTAQQKCSHYWIIERVAGPNSRGICKFCGAQKEFKNYLMDCLEVNEEEYQEWLRKLGHEKQEKVSEEDMLSWLGGVDRDTVKAGT